MKVWKKQKGLLVRTMIGQSCGSLFLWKFPACTGGSQSAGDRRTGRHCH